MLPASSDQTNRPAPRRKWPYVANRHRKAAIADAERILELVSADFLDLLQEELGHDIDEALMCVRSNPGLAIRHLQNAKLRLETVLRSAELVQSRAGQIVQVLLSAPTEEKAEPGEGEEPGE